MQAHTPQTPSRSLACAAARRVLAMLAVTGSVGAWAQETSPYYIGVNQALTYDSNVYRRSTNAVSDTYSSTSLVGGVDQPIGRQRIYGAANLSYNKYFSEGARDNTSYGLNAGWDWATVAQLSGNVSVRANQRLASEEGNDRQPTTSRNVLKAEQVGTNVRWGGDAALNLEGSYAHSRVRYSAPESLSSESYTDTASVGVYYRPSPDLRAGTAARYKRTVSPYAIPINAAPAGPGDYRSNTNGVRYLDFLANWRATARTDVNGKLSWTRQTDSVASGRDFSGLTGSLSANHELTAKLAFNALYSRDVGSQSSPFDYVRTSPATPISGPITTTLSGFTENSQVNDIFALGANYAATAKISANARLLYRRAQIVDTVAITGSTFTTTNEHTDTYRSAALGVNYDFARNVQFACSLTHETRNVGGLFAFSYSANIIGCSAQLTLR